MALKSKFLLWTATLLVCVVVLGSVSIWNLVIFRREAVAATAEYDAMDRAEAAVVQVGWLHDVLVGADAATYRDLKFFDPIQKQVLEIVRELEIGARVQDDAGKPELTQGIAAAAHLRRAVDRSTAQVGATHVVAAAAEAASELDSVRQSLSSVARRVPESVRRQIAGSADRLLVRIEWTVLWLLIVLIISAVIHVSEYRALVRPLMVLRDDLKRSASREFREEIASTGDQEFKDVASLFNGLARELAELYQSLEAKVIARSRELVRSERLASVGFLAAGVAHEINNPLTVISGYAELAAKAIARVMNGASHDGDPGNEEAEAEALSSAIDAQNIVRDEAFRCKEITSRLLSLARGGGDGREMLRMDDMARQVAVLIKGLKKYSDRRVIVQFGPADRLEVSANPTEMKQVLLNLTVNALEAVAPQRGEVRISGRRSGEWVEVAVEDNGKGMTPSTLQNVFEPFFTAKRGAGDPGTGLGLSITHAIIENHGGRITAASDGPGHGSRFTVRLPALQAVALRNLLVPAAAG